MAIDTMTIKAAMCYMGPQKQKKNDTWELDKQF